MSSQILGQHKSLFFRLPRELRDKIYIYCVSEDHGYLHDSSTGKLRLHDGRPIDNALMFTCKRVTRETQGLALRTNTITFRTQVSLPEAIDMPSDAALFEYLRKKRIDALGEMLCFAHSLVTSSVLQSLREKWPNSKAVAGLMASIERYGTQIMGRDTLSLYLYDMHCDNAEQEDILDDIIELIRSHADFDALTSIGYTKSKWYRWQLRHCVTDEHMKHLWEGKNFDESAGDFFIDELTGSPWYTEATRRSILDWKPERWQIPTREELRKTGKILVGWPKASIWYENVPGRVRPQYYSAIAVTVRFLQQLPLDIRVHIRQIVIEEDNPAVNESYAHIRGMERFWRENPSLKVEQRVDIWKTILIPQSSPITLFDTEVQVRDWIIQGRALCHQKTSIGSYSLVLHGPSTNASQNLSDVMIKLAKWQLGNVEFLNRVEQKFDRGTHCVTEDYSSIIKEIVDGAISVRFEAECIPGPWDPATILQEHQGDWPMDREEATEAYVFEEPDEGWEAARHASWAEIDIYDRLAWWNTLVEQL
ncbi:hypothetical protein HBI24_109770 [Parastagonospora nodorum]|nr:hypothetical protein HBH82_146570 [Parastagonospora nodorum]KAH4683985.1 hypothetical protein HBH78_119750 [Parastagonospora nodorum]KAH4704659.1 hypothetical protein HBH67_100630 [Parastagonospora nodorum]KAH4791078.1 hypothetical protein HBH62_039730 [Parastagonospora nodorum]KAH4795020.1 hypothetical protein HBH63_093800 [Parastagonospora nodorum]